MDKFGRMAGNGSSMGSFSEAARQNLRGPKGDGFLVDKDGHFNVENKRIKSMHDPEEDQDGVTKFYVDKYALKTLNNDVNAYDFFMKKLSNVAEPFSTNDVATMGFVEKKIFTLKKDILLEIQKKVEDILLKEKTQSTDKKTNKAQPKPTKKG